MPQDERVSQRVRASYDQIGELYTAQRSDLATAESYLRELVVRLPAKSTVLDIGCGAGVPIDRALLEEGFRVIGVDLSPKQIERARQLNPAGAYAVRDMLDLRPGDYHVDAVVSFFAIFHVPREHHRSLLKVIRSFLRPDGLLLVTMGASMDEGWDDFFGSTMFWSQYDPGQNHELVENAGFDILLDEIDASAGERHQILLAEAK
jgi:cyclopropane fatty-acyl-phospholipid synthase-like methyltransferase